MKIIEKAIRRLLDTNQFYANFFLSSRIVYDNPRIKTAAASLTSTGPALWFNTEWLSKYEPGQVCGVVEHEVLHLLFDHVSQWHPNSLFDKEIANIAMDLSINQYIKEMPPGAISLQAIKEETGLDLPPLQTWEYYYNRLIEVKDKLKSQSYYFDEHGEITDENGNPIEIPADAKEALKAAIGRAIKASAGNVPEHILKAFAGMKGESKVPWKQVLSNFVAKAASNTTVATRKKTNRRFGIDQPGKKRKRELTLGVCADSSGSISDESFQQFLTEVIKISKICSKVIFVDADCTVQSVEVLKKNKPVKLQRSGSGGTAYQPAINECMKNNVDAIVYLGDFDTSDTPKNPGVPFLWVGVGNSEPPAKFGSVIRL